MFLKIFIPVMLSLALVGCSGKEEKRLVFEKQFSLTGREILTDDIGITEFHVVDDFLLARQAKGEHFFSIYRLEDLKKVGVLGRKGSGPGEFPTFLLFDYLQYSEGRAYVWAHDLNQSILAKIDLQKSIQDSSTHIIREIKLPAERNFYTAFLIDSTTVIGRTSNSIPRMSRLLEYDLRNKQIKELVGLEPYFEPLSEDPNYLTTRYNRIYVSSIGYSPEKRLVASAMTSLNRIDIFDVNGKLKKSITESENSSYEEIEAFLSSAGNDDILNLYYNSIFCTDKYIAALFINCRLRDLAEFDKSSLRIFDWMGNPLATIDLNAAILSFTVDQKRGKLYGVDYNNEKLLFYNLNEVLDEL
jgi:hypothetical protein